MAQKYKTILTKIGKEKMAGLIAGEKLELTHIAVGDGELEPNEEQTSLQNEKYRGDVQKVEISSEKGNRINVLGIIPKQIGGFWIREFGVFDDEEDLIAVGNVPETYKSLASDGSDKELGYNVVIEVDNIDNIELEINESILYATKKELIELDGKINANLENIEEELHEEIEEIDSSFKGLILKLEKRIDKLHEVNKIKYVGNGSGSQKIKIKEKDDVEPKQITIYQETGSMNGAITYMFPRWYRNQFQNYTINASKGVVLYSSCDIVKDNGEWFLETGKGSGDNENQTNNAKDASYTIFIWY